MADSKRKDVLDAVETALLGSTGINYVTQNLDNWWDWKTERFPGVTLIDNVTVIERVAADSTSDTDRMATMELTVRCYVHDNSNVLSSKRTNLISDVTKIMLNSTTIDGEVSDVMHRSDETDNGVLEYYSVSDMTFDVSYYYNHLSP